MPSHYILVNEKIEYFVHDSRIDGEAKLFLTTGGKYW